MRGRRDEGGVTWSNLRSKMPETMVPAIVGGVLGREEVGGGHSWPYCSVRSTSLRTWAETESGKCQKGSARFRGLLTAYHVCISWARDECVCAI